MATSLFFMPTDQNSVGNPNELLRISTNLGVVNSSGEIRTTEPQTQKSRGRRPGSKKGQQNQKKPTLRGMGVAKLERERLKTEAAENKQIAATLVGDSPVATPMNPNNAARLLPVPVDPVLVLQGFPSSLGGCRNNRIYCGGVGSGQIMMGPVCSPNWGFVETSPHHHELSSIPNPQMYNAISDPRCDTCFKKKRVDEDQNNVVRSNGGGFSKYTMIHPPPMNGYEHLLQPDYQRSSSQGFMYDHHHRIARSAPPSAASTNPYLNEATNHTVSMEEYGSGYMEGNPRSGWGGGVKEYEFIPGKYDDGFPGKYGKRVSSMGTTSVLGDCTSSSTIDLSLKL
ncbi:PREDICTED: protein SPOROCYTELESS-like [Camelina sativa]|uniref:Protein SPOROCYTELESS-like n=1 Tax=Camelina sativa TaxID=90675 RepID=A0ABM0UBA0_CAMSA|nr:PREDICTED: protein SPOROCYTELESS-like [Camelina sativa]